MNYKDKRKAQLIEEIELLLALGGPSVVRLSGKPSASVSPPVRPGFYGR